MNTRRCFIKAIGAGAVSTALPLASFAAGSSSRPNVLFISIDDLKPFLRCYGNQTAITPNIDRIAAAGTVFLNNSCQQAVGGLSAASLMTGLYPDATRIFDLKTKMQDPTPGILAIPQHLKRNGYEIPGSGDTFDHRCVDKGGAIAGHACRQLSNLAKGNKPFFMSVRLTNRLTNGRNVFTSYIDNQVGKLLKKVKELGIEDNTMIVLREDHGASPDDDSQWRKHSSFEQALRSPIIISSPRQKRKGTITESPSEFVDIFPTLCELTGTTVPESLQGRSLQSVLDDPKVMIREAAMGQYSRAINGGLAMGYTLRSKRYRYVKWLTTNFRKSEQNGLLAGRELYDYKTDPHESVNIALDPERKQLIDKFEELFTVRNTAQHKGLLQGVIIPGES